MLRGQVMIPIFKYWNYLYIYTHSSHIHLWETKGRLNLTALKQILNLLNFLKLLLVASE